MPSSRPRRPMPHGRRGPPPPLDAFLTSRLREAGAIVLGKANMDEWATEIDPRQPKGFSDVGGRVRNPYTNGDPSGSSGGPAVSAASGLAASTVGTEDGGVHHPPLVRELGRGDQADARTDLARRGHPTARPE